MVGPPVHPFQLSIAVCLPLAHLAFEKLLAVRDDLQRTQPIECLSILTPGTSIHARVLAEWIVNVLLLLLQSPWQHSAQARPARKAQQVLQETLAELLQTEGPSWWAHLCHTGQACTLPRYDGLSKPPSFRLRLHT